MTKPKNSPAAFELIQVKTLEDPLPLPTNGPYLIATRKGFLVHKRFHFGRALLPTDQSPISPEIDPKDPAKLWLEPAQLPADIVGQAWSFFLAIWKTKKSEAMVDITWDKTHGYRLFVPPQTASMGGVKATRNLEHYAAGSQTVGTIHSHCNFAGFHSGTDTHDADSHDGLHITIGKVDQTTPDVASMIALSKFKWKLELGEAMKGPLKLVPHPSWWERYVSEPAPSTNYAMSGGFKALAGSKTNKPDIFTSFPDSTYDRKGKKNHHNPTKTYSIDEYIFDNIADTPPEEQQMLETIAEDLDAITIALTSLGIDFDYSIEAPTATRDTNNNTRMFSYD